jgi:cytochrome c oxidase cbb3-type subunit 1
MYIVRGLGGVLFIAGAIIMCINLYLTVKRQPAVETTNGLVPAE